MPNFKENKNPVMKRSGFTMKNSALKMSAKSGSPMQANYGSPLHEERHLLEKKKTAPMEGAPGGDPNYKSKSKDTTDIATREKNKPKSSEAIKSMSLTGKPKTPKTLSTKESSITKGDVVQTLVVPNVNIKKTIDVVKHYTPPKVKKTVKNVGTKVKNVGTKVKKWWNSPA